MMFKLAIAFCLAFAAVSAEYKCGPIQRLKVKMQWAEAYGVSEHREDLDTIIWKDMLRKFPETIDRYFKGVRGDNIYSPDFRAHMARVMGGLDMTISMLDEDDSFKAQVEHLHKQHVDLDVDAKYFEGFIYSLMMGVQSKIGRCFDQDAWLSCMNLVVGGIKH